MDKLSNDKPDDLEITSIGTLYRGHWDKKYWSSSRGKDRYPYPIGYQAIRTHTGNTYRMEIHEGLKGPVFLVTSPDGDLCSGQTPDIAWENFQKKSCPRVKNWLGKRLSSKIDGVELFGFKNPFVQRLLRELVANVDGVAERSSVAPAFCNRALKLDHERIEGSHAYPDLLPFLGKQQITGKRSMKNKSSSEKLIKEARIKRARGQGVLNKAECNSSYQEAQICSFSKSTVHFQEEHVSSSKYGASSQVATTHPSDSPGDGIAIQNNEALDPLFQTDGKTVGSASSIKICDITVESGSPLHAKTANVAVEKCSSLLDVDEVQTESKHSEGFVEKNILSDEQSCHIGHKIPIVTCLGKIPLKKPFDAELEQRNSLMLLKNSDGEPVDLVNHPDVCVSETCGTEKGKTLGSSIILQYWNFCVYVFFLSFLWKGILYIVTAIKPSDLLFGPPAEEYNASLCIMKNAPAVARPMPRTSIYCSSRFPLRSLHEELTSKSNHDISKSMHPQQDELHITCTSVDNFPRGIIEDSLPEAASSNSSLEKIDLDLAGQELARSMMTFLLPRAVPLLTKTYVKKRSRQRRRENKNNPRSISLATNSAEKVESEHTTNKMCQGNTVAKELVQGPEVNIQEKMNTSQALPGADPLCQVTKVEPLLAGCMTIEPFSESGSLKDIKSVIPCSFEVDKSAHDAINRKHVPSLNEVDIALLDEIKGHVNPPILPEDSSGRACFFSGNDGYTGEILLSDGNEKDNTEEVQSPRFMPIQGLSTSEKAEHSDVEAPCPRNKLEDELANTDIVQSHVICSSKKGHRYSPDDQVNVDVHAASDSKDAYVNCQVDVPHTSHVGHDGKASFMVNGESSLPCKHNLFSSGELLSDSHKIGRIPCSSVSSEKYSALSEIIICRNYKICDSPEMRLLQKIPDKGESDQARGSNADIRTSVTNKVKTDELHQLITVENVPASIHTKSNAAPDSSRDQDVSRNVNEDIKPSHLIDPSVSSSMDCVHSVSDVRIPGDCCVQSEERMNSLGSLCLSNTTGLDCKGHSHTQVPQKSYLDDYKGHSHTHVPQKSYLDDSSYKRESPTLETSDSMELVGCYLHPNPVLSVSLTSKEDNLHICVLCGLVDNDLRNLFMYRIPIQGFRRNSPSFLGYTSLMLPLLKDRCYQDIPIERSGLQFIPDMQTLVFLNSIKAPRCRDQNFYCSCTNCTSDCTGENTIEIVHVNFGYVSSVIKLVTTERVSSILAFEPNYLIAVEQSGELHAWEMNLEWSVNLEEFMLPKFDEISPAILELKRIPNCNSLIIGHNGLGDFGIWDISRRVVLAKFSSPGIITFQILPFGLFKWKSKDSLPTCVEMDHIREATPITDNWCSKAGEDSSLSSLEDMAVWLLVSADSGADPRHRVEESSTIPVGCWRLGLLVRSVVVLGSILDPRASAACTSSHYGMYGTCDGFLYKWELSSGEKLAGLHPFKCGSVSHIAIDTRSGALAVAGNGCQMLVYAQSRLS